MIYFGFVIVVVVAVAVVAASQVRTCFLQRDKKLKQYEDTLRTRKISFFEANRRKRPPRGKRKAWLKAEAKVEALATVKQEPKNKKAATDKGQPSKPRPKKLLLPLDST